MKNCLLALGVAFALSAMGCATTGHHCDHEHHDCSSCCKKDGGKDGHDCGKGDEGCKMKHADQAPAAPADASKPATK